MAKQTIITDLTPFDYEKVSVATSAVARLDETKREGAKGVFITVETASIRYRVDSGDPDSDDGHLVLDEQNLYLASPAAVRQFRAIAPLSTATLIVTYYR